MVPSSGYDPHAVGHGRNRLCEVVSREYSHLTTRSGVEPGESLSSLGGPEDTNVAGSWVMKLRLAAREDSRGSRTAGLAGGGLRPGHPAGH